VALLKKVYAKTKPQTKENINLRPLQNSHSRSGGFICKSSAWLIDSNSPLNTAKCSAGLQI